ncbi:tRNA(5-methylaminomethyl-2-thiouridylate) methyltransferase [Tumebacillus flagellatus]|uniref:tRNA(5-methylaminomethyl-2-thiouridylate) methyltransferase n=3 Tax=Tumebacillus flagellatus TaxID=1157490 RepID=A0A074MFP9_9BACL|nr:tRNA(5-methylaminomethyl-2-thiouridylate) methyltransferase [Tumebacillus flagellatus]
MPKGATETKTLKVGDKAPDFTLKAHGDRTVNLSDYRGKNVFIAFYPLDWTPV